jgi:hypothetical protein
MQAMRPAGTPAGRSEFNIPALGAAPGAASIGFGVARKNGRFAGPELKRLC